MRGLGWKNVVFGGMRSPPCAMSHDLSDGRRAQQHAGVGLALVDRARPRSRRRAGSVSSWAGSAARAASSRAESRSRASRERVGSGRSEPRTRSGSTSASAPARPFGHGAGDRRRRSAGHGLEERLERRRRGRNRRAGREMRRWIGVHGELVVGELDDERHASRSSAPGAVSALAARRGRRARSRSGGGRRRSRPARSRPRPRSRVAAAGSSTTPELWVTPSSSVQLATGGPARVEQVGQARRPATGPRSATGWHSVARSRSSRSLLAFGVVCSWGRISPSPGRLSSSAPMHAGGVAAHARLVGEVHAVHVERSARGRRRGCPPRASARRRDRGLGVGVALALRGRSTATMLSG